jgi:hypothetical protein
MLPEPSPVGTGRENSAWFDGNGTMEWMSPEAEIAAILDAGAGAQALLAASQLPPGIRTGLWLRCGFWAEAHNVAQDLHTPTGSYWHAILHRAEPDEFNAGYWFRKIGSHPVLLQMADRWDLNAFTHASPAQREREAQLLLDFCISNFV